MTLSIIDLIVTLSIKIFSISIECHYAVSHFYCYVEHHYSECRYAECRYAECRGPDTTTKGPISVLILENLN
jgi:hypothetical protein